MSAAPVDPWSDRAALAAAAADCRATRERLLARLSARLAELHGADLGVRYWRIVLGPWLLYHLQQLEDRRDTVRAKAMEALGYVKDERSFALLLDKLQNEKNANVREGAAKGLKHAGRQEAIPALKAAVANEKSQPVRGAAIETLKALGATAD